MHTGPMRTDISQQTFCLTKLTMLSTVEKVDVDRSTRWESGASRSPQSMCIAIGEVRIGECRYVSLGLCYSIDSRRPKRSSGSGIEAASECGGLMQGSPCGRYDLLGKFTTRKDHFVMQIKRGRVEFSGELCVIKRE